MQEPSDPGERGGDWKPPLVSLCVITFRRPTGLRRLVESLAQLEFRNDPARIELIVVDNDAAGSAEGVCAKLSREVGFPIKYGVEPRRGIPMARNRSIRMIDESSDFVVFVDDDETVAANWLDELLRVQRTCTADVVSGPVVPDFLAPPPRWIVEGAFFEPQRHRTGERILHAYTSNTLVRASVLAELGGGGFDERLALSGGSDTHFFLRVGRVGYKLVWADEAIVYDCIPTSRMNARWLLQRSYRQGVMTIFVIRDVRGVAGGAPQMRTGARRVTKGMLMLPISWLFGWHRFVECLRCTCFVGGLLGGLLGLRYQEYRNIYGR